MYFARILAMHCWWFVSHIEIIVHSLVVWERASSFVNCLYGVVSHRWMRQSVTYCSYLMAQGPSALLELGKRMFWLRVMECKILFWKGRRLGIDRFLVKTDFIFSENVMI